jgi:hypothetical protein
MSCPPYHRDCAERTLVLRLFRMGGQLRLNGFHRFVPQSVEVGLFF